MLAVGEPLFWSKDHFLAGRVTNGQQNVGAATADWSRAADPQLPKFAACLPARGAAQRQRKTNATLHRVGRNDDLVVAVPTTPAGTPTSPPIHVATDSMSLALLYKCVSKRASPLCH